jgi:hypothetical protein
LGIDELSANITTISQELNTDATTIKHVSLVGCNLASDNPTDNNTSTYGAEMFIGWSYTRFFFLALIGNPTWLFLQSHNSIDLVVSDKKIFKISANENTLF